MINTVNYYPEWLGVLPDDWQLTDIGRVYEERKQKVSDTDFTPLSVTMNGIHFLAKALLPIMMEL